VTRLGSPKEQIRRMPALVTVSTQIPSCHPACPTRNRIPERTPKRPAQSCLFESPIGLSGLFGIGQIHDHVSLPLPIKRQRHVIMSLWGLAGPVAWREGRA
jgi:hypothetical protein